MNRYISLFAILLFTHSVIGQTKPVNTNNRNKNIVDLTIAGGGIGISVNYSRIVKENAIYFINTSIGVGKVPFSGSFSFPHQVSYNLGKQSSFLELGLGGTYSFYNDTSTDAYQYKDSYGVYPIIGWRKYFKNNLVFRVYTNPIIHVYGEYLLEDYKITPYGGLSLGYSF